jgi:hypothetical protein
MTLATELVALANDYISGRVDLAALDRFIHGHVDESLELDQTGSPEALLFGFIQVHIYQMDDGLAEDVVRRDIAQYLAKYDLLLPATRQRATG